ncbi:MAG TPA: gamma-glutamylcyclotransferase family protein [Phenylobacterium sp.]|uniref:gamma-glutamylcyclotransferase family protein n=1 Tax=Phenylobacterium sp. TaxID=1871053 RepID=UPI002D3F99D9|nr:gamma-glutamylcyclotransferase family protein [Phenylobacterium sp.]HZZ67453.1 gamma-glutamylcyclotransferase family protein [Phenylobacterium sp.]
MNANHRLAVYGSLAPGRSNHGQLAELTGAWSPGVVRGELFQEGWGAAQGYPGLRLDPAGAEVAVQVFASHDLPDHWARLDRFEGPEYRRVITTVMTEDGPVEANIYAIAKPP